MANETVKLENAEQFREAIGVLAGEIVQLKEVQAAQGELLVKMDAKIKATVALTDIHRQVLEKIAALPPRPKASTDVN